MRHIYSDTDDCYREKNIAFLYNHQSCPPSCGFFRFFATTMCLSIFLAAEFKGLMKGLDGYLCFYVSMYPYLRIYPSYVSVPMYLSFHACMYMSYECFL